MYVYMYICMFSMTYVNLQLSERQDVMAEYRRCVYASFRWTMFQGMYVCMHVFVGLCEAALSERQDVIAEYSNVCVYACMFWLTYVTL